MESVYLPDMSESAANVMAATVVSQSLSFCMERKYLANIDDRILNPYFSLKEMEANSKDDISWIEITQIGKPLDNAAENSFTAMQKILYSCFMPKETQLLFLITGDERSNRMYLGVRPMGDQVSGRISHYLVDFMKGTWPGLQCKPITDTDNDQGLQRFMSNVKKDSYDCIYAMTGIPSMESQYKTTYPATIDKLMAGMNGSKAYAYLVVADPIEPGDVDSMLYQCREMNGQAESLKSFNVTEGATIGSSESRGHTETISEGDAYTTQESTSKRSTAGIIGAAVGAAAVGAVAFAFAFPPAAAVVAAGGKAIAAAGGKAAMFSSIIGGNAFSLFSSFGSTKSKGTSQSKSYQKSSAQSYNYTTNESQSRSISRNIVNKHIESVAEHLFYHGKRLETGKATGMWKVGAYLLAQRESEAKGGAMQLRSILSGQESIFEPIRFTNISKLKTIKRSLGYCEAPIIRVNAVNGDTFNHPLGDHYKELKTVLTTKELSYLINFPLRSVPGISVIDSSPEFSLNLPEKKTDGHQIKIGKLLYGGSPTSMDYQIPLDSFARHTLLSGINGSGKTNTVLAILNSLQEKIPFLVIEPAKTEYVDWAIEYNKNHPQHPIDIYIPGCKQYRNGFTPKQLKLNPFELVWLDKEQEPNVLSHIDRLKSTFAAAFPMYDILPVLMEDLIYTIYQNKSTDWLGQEPRFGVTMPPTLNSMRVNVDKVISNRQYEERIERNMKACLNTRIDSLMRGWKGTMLNTLHSTPWMDLFERPCLINLSYVGDDVDKSFFMALILQFLYEYRSALAEIGLVDFNDNSCKHLTVIEEAHRVMARCENQELPQYKSAMMFSNMLSEIRAYGEGMFLVDQVPTRLIPDAIKNTNLKITHRLVAEDDSKAIGESMGLNDEQRKVIAKLMTGQCIVSSSLSTDTFWIQVHKTK